MNTYHITFSPNSDPDNIQRETLLADSIQQINATYQANDCTIIRFEVKTEEANHTACLLSDAMKDCDNCKFQPEVAPWDVIRDLGTRFIISGGEVLELDSHLESAYDERNGDIETDMPY